jgi:flagellar basal body P-ring formation protein FlgA
MHTSLAILMRSSFALLLAAMLLPLAAVAADFQRGDAISAAAALAGRAHAAALAGPTATIRVTATPPDAGLRLPACAQDLATEIPPGSGLARFSVVVRCGQPASWRLYVPVTVTAEKPVVVAARSLARDTILAPGDVRLARQDLGALPYGSFSSADLVVGRRLRREVAEGAVLGPGLLLTPPLIKRGQTVTLEARARGFSVQMAGLARSDGQLGETIRVQNISSGRVREAVVRSAKSVEVLLR